MSYQSFVGSAVALLSFVLFTTGAEAVPVAPAGTEGLMLFVGSADPVIAKFQGHAAFFTDDLYLSSPAGVYSTTIIFRNQTATVGDTVDLGSFPIGTELIFRIHVDDPTNAFEPNELDWFTGPASRNADNKAHARVQQNWLPNETLVSFEDWVDFNYSDLSFSFTNTQTSPPVTGSVPEPVTIGFLALGVAGLCAVARLRNGGTTVR